MEKTLRVLGNEEGSSGHSQSHSHSHVQTSTVQASGVDSSASQNGLRSRGSEKSDSGSGPTEPAQSNNGPSKLSAYLNLFGDFVHNMLVHITLFYPDFLTIFPHHSTDGLAYVFFGLISLLSIDTIKICFLNKFLVWRHPSMHLLLLVQQQRLPASHMRSLMKLRTTLYWSVVVLRRNKPCNHNS